MVLECEWDRLAGVADFRLCCAYPVAALAAGGPDAEAVLDCHSLVVD